MYHDPQAFAETLARIEDERLRREAARDLAVLRVDLAFGLAIGAVMIAVLLALHWEKVRAGAVLWFL